MDFDTKIKFFKNKFTKEKKKLDVLPCIAELTNELSFYY